MNTKLLSVLAGAALFAGCVYPSRVVVAAPAPYAEVIPASPGPGYVWVRGHWAWRDGRHVWIQGRYIAQQPGGVWIEGHYSNAPGGYVWVEGHWR